MDFKLVFCLTFLYAINSIEAECICGNYVGYHCGERGNDASITLNGKCKSNTLYECKSINDVAIEKFYCNHCVKSARMGNDFCTTRQECI